MNGSMKNNSISYNIISEYEKGATDFISRSVEISSSHNAPVITLKSWKVNPKQFAMAVCINS